MSTLNDCIDELFSAIALILPKHIIMIPSSTKVATYQKLETKTSLNITKNSRGFYKENNTNYIFGNYQNFHVVIAKEDVKSRLGFTEF